MSDRVLAAMTWPHLERFVPPELSTPLVVESFVWIQSIETPSPGSRRDWYYRSSKNLAKVRMTTSGDRFDETFNVYLAQEELSRVYSSRLKNRVRLILVFDD